MFLDIQSSCRALTLPSGEGATYNSAMHAMDCTDIVVGSADGAMYRILDYYTRDRSTPREDTFWGGEFSLTGAIGKQENGMTTIRFSRKLTGKYGKKAPLVLS